MLEKNTLVRNLDNFYQSLRLPLFLLDQDYLILYQCTSFFKVNNTILKEQLLEMKQFHSKLDTYIKQQELYFLIPYHDTECKFLCVGPILLRKIPRSVNLSYIKFYDAMHKKPDPADFLDRIGYFGDDLIPKIKLLYHLLNDDTLSVEEVKRSLAQKKQSWTETILPTHLFHEREEESSYSYMEQQKFLHYLSLGDSLTARMYASKIIVGRIGSMSNDEMRKFKYAFVSGVSLMTHTSIKCNVPVSKAYTLSDVFIKQADESYQMEDLVNLYYQCTQEFCKLITKHKQNENYPLWVRTCIEYIDKNLHTPITLEDLGDMVHMAPAYISVHFKKITSQSIKDCINQKKIQEAQYLLQHTAMSIQEISIILQYSSSSYFSKVFIRYTGVLPNEFRRSNAV